MAIRYRDGRVVLITTTFFKPLSIAIKQAVAGVTSPLVLVTGALFIAVITAGGARDCFPPPRRASEPNATTRKLGAVTKSYNSVLLVA